MPGWFEAVFYYWRLLLMWKTDVDCDNTNRIRSSCQHFYEASHVWWIGEFFGSGHQAGNGDKKRWGWKDGMVRSFHEVTENEILSIKNLCNRDRCFEGLQLHWPLLKMPARYFLNLPVADWRFLFACKRSYTSGSLLFEGGLIFCKDSALRTLGRTIKGILLLSKHTGQSFLVQGHPDRHYLL